MSAIISGIKSSKSDSAVIPEYEKILLNKVCAAFPIVVYATIVCAIFVPVKTPYFFSGTIFLAIRQMITVITMSGRVFPRGISTPIRYL